MTRSTKLKIHRARKLENRKSQHKSFPFFVAVIVTFEQQFVLIAEIGQSFGRIAFR